MLGGEAASVEYETVVLMERMITYPELAPAVASVRDQYRFTMRQQINDCRENTKGAETRANYDARAEELKRRHLQISGVSAAFARYRIAVGH